MNRKLLTSLIISLALTGSANAEFGFDSVSDYTGEAFFAPPSIEQNSTKDQNSDTKTTKTIPPIKLLRLKLKERSLLKQQKQFEPAPTNSDSYVGEIETSQYASQEIKDDFDEMTSDGFDADEELTSETKKEKKSLFKNKKASSEENSDENIILDCQQVDYDTENYLIHAVGDTSVEFVKQETVVKADTITFDRMNNTIKAEGNVKIIKNGQIITGDYIFVDMNEENALIENPLTRTETIEIKSQKGYVYGDRIVQEKGKMKVNESYPIVLEATGAGPRIREMLVPKDENLTNDMSKGIITFKAQDIKITKKGDLEIISLKRPKLFRDEKLIFKTPSVNIYTNKNHDYVETNHWEFGAVRGMGTYIGPGFVAELPKGSVLKIMPVLNYKSGIGVGGVGRFSSGTNHTLIGYGTATNKILAYGKQGLDDNLYLHYAMNNYMPEEFLGRRRPKYGLALVYRKTYSEKDFLIKDQTSSFMHRFEGGYFHDLDFDNRFEKIKDDSNIGTTRFRYMAEARQSFYEYKDEEKLKALRFDLTGQLASTLYGTGDTQVIGRLGPTLHLQYKRWMQDIGYLFSVYDDNTPMPRFDAYRYGKQSLYVREYLRLCRWLTVAWFGNIVISNDAPDGRTFQENGFYFSMGPDDIKVNLGYDFIRESLRCSIDVLMDAKGTNVEYDTFEIKETKKAKATEKIQETESTDNPYKAPVQPKVLNKAVVENIKVQEDVL